MLIILKAIIGWGIIVLISINLFGLVVRGLMWAPPVIEAEASGRVRSLLTKESRRLVAANAGMTLFGLLLAAGYLFALYHVWNMWMAIAAVLIMAARIPDLTWKIRNGACVSRRNCPQGALYIFATLLTFGTLPLVWYSLWK